MTNNQLTTSFISQGYDDYIASRFLLNNGFILQGVILASNAVEKYLKGALASQGVSRKVHLDRLNEIQNLLSEHYFDFTSFFDTRFLEILGKAYKARYMDGLSEPTTIGFFVSQFLGELDTFIDFFENKVIIGFTDDKTGQPLLTPYRRAIGELDKNLFSNNYILAGISKKEHMEKPDNGFAVFLNPETGSIIEARGTNIKNEYDGTLADIRINGH